MKACISSGRWLGGALIAVQLIVAANFAGAVPVTFNLLDPTATTEIESGTIVRSGITATLTAVVAGSTGSLNQTASAFGINAADLPNVTNDDSDELDSDEGVESISIRFDVDVLWQALKVSSFGTGEQGSLVVAAFSPVSITATGEHTRTTDNLVLAGQAVVISHVAGTGFSFDSFTVERSERLLADVPDAGSSAMLLGLAFGGLSLIVRRRR